MRKIRVNRNDEILILNNVDNGIHIRVKDININRIKFAVNAPQDFEINLRELYDKQQIEREQAMQFYYQKNTEPENPKTAPFNRKEYRPKVLVVEDYKPAQIVAFTNLEDLNCIVDIAEDGEEAIRRFNDAYDLILLDIGLPKINGLEVCRMIRKKQTRPVLIIMWTAYTQEIAEKSLEVGADDFVLKDGGFRKIKEYISKIKKRKKFSNVL